MEVAEQIDRRTARVVAVNFDTPERVARYAAAFGRDVLFLCDPERVLYTRFGLGRASRSRVWFHPAVWRSYARLLRSGYRLSRAPVGDTLQLGGDVVLDAALRPVWTYRSRGPEDRPAIDEVVRRARAAAI